MSVSVKSTDPIDFYAGMVAPVFIAAWVVPVVLLRAWVITMLWAWYIVPGFGAAPLRMSIAFGLSVLVAMLAPKSDSEKKSFPVVVLLSFLNQLIPLLIGWVGSFFV